MTSKLKVYELAKELGQDSQHLVDVVQRLGIDIKNSMSVLGSEEVRTVREYYKKQKPLAKGAAKAETAKAPMTEKRVGATVIRRRSASTSAPGAGRAAEKSPESPVLHEAAEVEAQAEPELVPPPPPPGVEAEAIEEEIVAEVAEAAAEMRVEEGPEPVTEEPGVRAQAAQVSAPVSAAPVAAPATPPKPRRVFPSIIKKVATEQYLGEKVGPKVERPKTEPKPKTAASAADAAKQKAAVPGAKPGQAGAQTGAAAAGALAPGLKRVKEIEFAPATEAAKEATKRKLMERQSTVFKSADYLKRELVHATKKKKNAINRPAMKTQITQPAEHKRIVEMGDTITVGDLAREMGVKASAIVGKLMGLGVTATINQPIDHDTAALVAHEFQHEIKQKVFKEEDFVPAVDLAAEKLKTRPPVVTIMGHVDHGKTSLLDSIRKTKVAAGEAGGITQHIGAYTVQVPKGKITFVDTPGHEAFTAMRARGAKVTDIVVIVVSAVDGVMPQTLESVSHSQAAGVPIIVAINKIDLPDGNPDRIKQTLAGHNLAPEEWGGETIYVPVSAKTGQGLDQLLESILLQAEMLELKANYDTPARGTIVESRLDKNRGAVATILVQHGKLSPGDVVVCGTSYGKVRAMTNSFGQKVNEALPSDPVEVLGLPEVPNVGDDIFVVEDDRKARELSEARMQHLKAQAGEARPKLSLADMMAQQGTDKEVRLILRADVQGSAEALREALSKFPAEKVKLKILHTGSGGVSESDIMLAAASRAIILGFNIRPEVKAQKLADAEHVEIRTYNIIYDLLEDVKKLLEGQLDKVVKERVIGRAEVRDVFHIPKVGTIAGSAVIDGKVQRGCFLRLLRDSRVVYEGKISSLRRFKEDVKEVASGFECGIGLENFNDVKLGDQFEAFLKEETQGTL